MRIFFSQARTHQLLVHNKELLDHIASLVSLLHDQERIRSELQHHSLPPVSAVPCLNNLPYPFFFFFTFVPFLSQLDRTIYYYYYYLHLHVCMICVLVRSYNINKRVRCCYITFYNNYYYPRIFNANKINKSCSSSCSYKWCFILKCATDVLFFDTVQCVLLLTILCHLLFDVYNRFPIKLTYPGYPGRLAGTLSFVF